MGITFNEKIEGWRKWFGLTGVMFYAFLGQFMVLWISNVSKGVSDFVNYFFDIIFWIGVPLIFAGVIFKPLKQQNVKRIIKWSLIGLLSLFATNIIFSNFITPQLMNLFKVENFANANSNSLKDKLLSDNMILTIFWAFMIVILGPFVEEILYRVCLFTTLRKKTKITAHFVTAILFGFQHVCIAMFFGSHPQEIILIGSYMAFSLILTVMYEKLKTPIPGIMSHMLSNAVAVAFALISM